MRTLALETSATPGSLALLADGVIVYQARLPDQRRTTETFAVEIQRGLQSERWLPRTVELLAVAQGPGSFTGLRIGITAAKMFAYAVGCPVVAVNTLELLAFQVRHSAPTVWVTLDAQRKQLFVAQYEFVQTLPHAIQAVQIVDAESFLKRLGPDEVVTGSGLLKWQTIIPPQVRQISDNLWTPDAAALGQLARLHFEAGRIADIWSLTPQYYRDSAAEEKRRGSAS